MSGRVERYAPWAFALAVLAVLGATRGPALPVGVFYDDGIYVDLAKAIGSGNGYHHLALPGTPAGVHYPPLYPLWLALWGFLRPPLGAVGAMGWLKIGNALLAAGCIVPWTRWGMRRLQLPWWLAGLGAAAAVLVVPARAVTSTLFSEPLAWLLLGVTFDLADDGEGDRPLDQRRIVAAAIVAALLPLARTILLPVTLAVAWRFGTESAKPVKLRQREATLAAFMLIPMLAWSAWTRQHAAEIPAAWVGSYGSYGGMWREAVTGAGDLVALVAHQATGLWHTARAAWGFPGAVLGIALTLFGIWQLRGWRSVALVGTAGYFAIILIWPIPPDRFLWGMLPPVTLLMLGGLRAIPCPTFMKCRYRPLGLTALLVIPMYRCVPLNVRGYRNDGWIVPQKREAENYAPLVRWGWTIPKDAVVLTANDPLFAQATGLTSAPLLTPDLRETRGLPPLHSAIERVASSACAAGEGWMAVVDTLDEAGAAIRALQMVPSGAVRFNRTVHLDGARAAVHFRCRP